jgi:hypothetical protein
VRNRWTRKWPLVCGAHLPVCDAFPLAQPIFHLPFFSFAPP